ncbi:MAG: PilZ domain-containing protein [Desulfobacterales bacterium]|jgi:hypothetical protein
MRKIYLDNSKKTTIVCSRCLFEQSIDLNNIKHDQKILKIRCKCGKDNEFTIEYRNGYRKDVNLYGEYTIQKSGKEGDIIIKDLSMGGIRFENLSLHQISKDDILEVKFQLDNPKRSEIKKSVKVIWVKDQNIGANFIETQSYKADLGFYLQT